jgi:ribulose-phosphate 3-epimerase
MKKEINKFLYFYRFLATASELLKDKNIDIEVDGSIDDKTAVLCQAAGANVFVSGGYIFNNNNIEQQIVKLQQALKIKNKI